MKSSIYSKLLICVASFFILAISLLATQYITFLSTYLMLSYIILLGIIFVYFLTNKSNKKMYGPSFLGMTIVVIVILRLIWILKVDTTPISDFETYNINAQQMSEQIPSNLLSIKFGCQGFGYVLSLALIYKIFGYSLMIGKLFNIVLSVFTGILLYLITKKLFSERTARIAILLFAFLPSQIMYTSVIAAEHIYVLSILLGLYILTYGSFKYSYKNEYYSGIILGFGAMVRQTALIVVAACIVYIFFEQKQDRFKKIFSFVKGAILILIVFHILLLLDKNPDPTTGIENSLMVGTNYESTGKWNLADSQIWSDWWNTSNSSFNLKDAKSTALHLAYGRIVDNPMKFVVLVFKKYDIMWAREGYGVDWSTMKLNSPNFFIDQNKNVLYGISQFYYFLILILTLLGCFKLWKTQNDNANIFLIAFILFVFAHSFLEVQPRYHYLFTFVFLILASYGLTENKVNTIEYK